MAPDLIKREADIIQVMKRMDEIQNLPWGERMDILLMLMRSHSDVYLAAARRLAHRG